MHIFLWNNAILDSVGWQRVKRELNFCADWAIKHGSHGRLVVGYQNRSWHHDLGLKALKTKTKSQIPQSHNSIIDCHQNCDKKRDYVITQFISLLNLWLPPVDRSIFQKSMITFRSCFENITFNLHSIHWHAITQTIG